MQAGQAGDERSHAGERSDIVLFLVLPQPARVITYGKGKMRIRRQVIDVHVHHPGATDPEMDAYVEQMEKYGVVAALVNAVADDSYTELGGNESVLRVVRRHPGRLFGSAYIDLRDPVRKTIRTIEKYADAGFRFVKMFPNFGFDPNDECHEPVWRALEKRGMGCLSHCGWVAGPKQDRRLRIHSLTASPFHFEVPARRHPGINFIFAHFGGGATYLETIVLTSRLPNAYADVTPGWGRWVFENRMPGLNALYFTQVLYGTDNAGVRYGQDIQWWVRTLRAMGRSADDLDNFFCNNAARLLGIAPVQARESRPRGRALARK